MKVRAQTYVIPVHIHDAGLLQPSGALASQRYLEVSIESANRWFEGAGVCFFIQARQPFPALEAYEEIKSQLPRGAAIHAAIVRQLSHEGRRVNGVATDGTTRTLALSRVRANRLTLAHELGHVLGLGHSESGVMHSDRDWWNPNEQMARADIRTVRRGAQAFTSRFGSSSPRRCVRHSVPEPANISADDSLLIRGSRTYSSGTRYVGSLLFGRRHGLGNITYGNNGATYAGMWRIGERHGQGTYRLGGRRYVGDWAADQRDGHGHERYASGAEYEGAFARDQRHGLGEYRYAGGGQYRGSWRRGERTGFGQYTFANGNRHEGQWRRNERHGFGTYRFASGRRLVGEWRNGRRSSTRNICSR